jgi:pyruvate/2-oxoglutarate dehydrogenase complex dihydrolipoamide dehydrogenase (E3) component
MTTLTPDLAVIGAGSGGLSVAAGAVQMGASVVLVEKGKMGGDCLNYGCVPSKSLLAAAHAAQVVRTAGRYGVNGHEPEVDFLKVRDHVRGVIAGIAPHDSVERFEGLGVKVVQAAARFTGNGLELEAGGTRISPRRVVLATGSRASIPPVPGLAEAPHLTNETIFDLAERPERLIVIGGGPIGCELAQAHRRLGTPVTILQRPSILPKDDPAAVEVVRRSLVADGIDLREGVEVRRVERRGNGVAVTVAPKGGGPESVVEGSHLLVAVGRQANVDGLGLEKVGIEYDAKGAKTDDSLRTTNRKVWAVGDVAGRWQFTHIASYHASVVIKQALFRLPAKVDDKAVPWVTFTDPELAQVGLTEAMAKERGLDLTPLTFAYEENDRARAERQTEGFAKALVDAKGRIFGATIVGAHAGELIGLWGLAIGQGIKIGAVAQMIAPYPTLSEVSKRAAGSYYTPKLFSDRTRKVVRLLGRLG